MALPRLLFATLLAASGCSHASAQSLTSRLIATDGPDSALRNAYHLNFDAQGNYRNVLRAGKDTNYIVVNGRTLGPFRNIYDRDGSGGSILATYDDKHPGEPWYYANDEIAGPLYGPVQGKLIDHYAPEDCGHSIAITTWYHDSVSCYINDRLVYRVRRDKEPRQLFDYSSVIAFADNSHAIYVVESQDGRKSLWLDDSLLHTGAAGYEALHVNNRGDYLFATVENKTDSPSRYYHRFLVHTRDSTYGLVHTVKRHNLNEDGGWYVQGDFEPHNGEYALVNGHMIRGMYDPGQVVLAGGDHSLFLAKVESESEDEHEDDDENRVLVADGMAFPLPYEKVLYPTTDTTGHFAAYGLRDYYLYRFVDGREAGALSRYGVRAEPLYISPTGMSLHFFRTDDSAYLYWGDVLLFHPFAATFAPLVQAPNDLLPKRRYRPAEASRPLLYIAADSAGFFFWKGTFSRPMLLADRRSYRNEPHERGEIVAGEETDADFYVIQCTGPHQYRANINNAVYHDFEGPDTMPYDAAFFDAAARRLVFYGFRFSDLYQYTLEW